MTSTERKAQLAEFIQIMSNAEGTKHIEDVYLFLGEHAEQIRKREEMMSLANTVSMNLEQVIWDRLRGVLSHHIKLTIE